MINKGKPRYRRPIPVLTAFVPFGILLIQNFNPVMPLRWVSLVTMLELISLYSIYINFAANDVLWGFFGLWAFIVVCRPVYFALLETQTKKGIKNNFNRLTFRNLFKLCSNSIFSDYRITLTASIPMVIQVLAGGSIVYKIYGGDWVMHTLAGFGIGATAFKAYRTALKKYGYRSLASYFHLDQISFPENERKSGSLEFVLFSVVVVAVLWEIFEITLCLIAPGNIFRIAMEPAANMLIDIIVAIGGGTIGWYLIKYKLRWF